MGIFGLGEILFNIDKRETQGSILETPKSLLPTAEDWKRSTLPIARGSLLGFGIAVIPGGMPAVASLLSYAVGKRVSRGLEEFVPLLTFGIPTNSVLALMLAAMMLQGVTPGPLLLLKRPNVFWGVIASMCLGNVMLRILNLPLVQLFGQITKVPKPILLPLITPMCLVGVYSVNSSYVDLYVLALFGILGFILRDLGYSPAPLVLALVIGPMMENALRSSLMINQGAIAPMIFRPIAGTIYLASALALIIPPFYRAIRRKKPPQAF